MSTADIEMEDLSKRKSSHSTTQPENPHDGILQSQASDGVLSSWAWASSAIFFATSSLLMFAPKLLLFLSESGEERRTSLTPLESFLAWNMGLILSAISVCLVMNIPSGLEDFGAKRETPNHPLLGPFSVTCVLISFIAYNTTSVGSLGLLLCLGSGTIGLWGLWAIMFAGSSSISRKTGADKRTSAFIFGNKAAASSQKREWKKAQAGRP